MRAFTTIFVTDALSAMLEHIEQTPDLGPALPGVLDFKTAPLKRVEQPGKDLPGLSDHQAQAA